MHFLHGLPPTSVDFPELLPHRLTPDPISTSIDFHDNLYRLRPFSTDFHLLLCSGAQKQNGLAPTSISPPTDRLPPTSAIYHADLYTYFIEPHSLPLNFHELSYRVVR